jgi:hypothetical protein
MIEALAVLVLPVGVVDAHIGEAGIFAGIFGIGNRVAAVDQRAEVQDEVVFHLVDTDGDL